MIGRKASPPPTKDHIEGHISGLKSITKYHNKKNTVDPIRLDFGVEDTKVRDNIIVKGKAMVDDDLKKPFKEAQTLDGSAKGWFERLPANSINEWSELMKAFAARYSTVKIGFIMGVSEVMKIASFMDSLKCPELAKRFSYKVPTAVDKMMSEEKSVLTEITKEEKLGGTTTETTTRRDSYDPYRGRDNQAPYPPPKGDYQARATSVLALNARTKPPKEILATKTQLCLPPPRPMINPFKGGNTNRYCDYHQEKGHYTND
ncbi:hypothetical protein Tco_1083971, partial [Tanacetum coccineum]